MNVRRKSDSTLARGVVRLSVGVTVTLFVVAAVTACSHGPSEEKTMDAVPTAEHQQGLAVAYASKTMRVSGLEWDDAQSEEWAQDCALGSARGALYNFTTTATGAADPASVAKRVGAAWKAEGLDVRTSRASMSSGAEQYVVNGRGGDVERIQFGVATTKASLLGASHCGMGNAADLG